MSKKIITSIIMIVGVCILAASIAGYFLYKKYYLPSTATLSPLPQTLNFPTQETQYPAKWPDDLKFPDKFVLVDSTSGSLPENTTTSWSARFIYKGKTKDTVNATLSFLESKGWTISENTSVDSNNTSILVEKNTSSGIIAISSDPNNPSQTLITASFFP